MSSKPARRGRAAASPPSFTPVATRTRHDGWTPERQGEFIEALAECGCVDEACRRVGMSASAAYTLRRRVDAQSFRQAWDFALDYAIRRLSDAAFSRALHGVAQPVFFQGQQIGERRRYDERLTMFLLRYRDPVRYGAWLDQMRAERHPDGAAISLAKMVGRVSDDAHARDAGERAPRRPPLVPVRRVSPEEAAEEAERAAQARADAAARRDQAERDAEFEAWVAQEHAKRGDVA